MKLQTLLRLLTLSLAPFLSLTNAFPFQFPFLSIVNDEPHLISIHEDELIKVSELDILNFKRSNVQFVDLTNQYQHLLTSEYEELFNVNADGYSFTNVKIQKDVIVPVYNYPNKSTFHQSTVYPLISQINTTRMFDTLTKFSSFYSRYYKSERYLSSTIWLYDQLLELTLLNDHYSLTMVSHTQFPQPSLILRVAGTTNETIVLGCHIDSINLLWPDLLAAPGADDDGSGVVTLLETLNILTDRNLTINFKNNIEFHFYAAEEGGMLGSLDIFDQYASELSSFKNITAMLQQDMTGYTAKSVLMGYPEHFGLITDYTSSSLNEFLKDVITEYCSIGYIETQCGYACSDHYSAIINGYPSSFVVESKFGLDDPYIHTVSDTVEQLNFLHIAEHVKLCLGYIVELGFFTNF